MSVTLTNVAYTYPGTDRPVFRDLNFTSAGNEILALLGRSGSGKSTLLNILLGYLRLPEGSVEIGGEPVNGPSSSRAPIFQVDGLWPWLSATENVTLPFLMKGGRRLAKTLETEAHTALRSCGIVSEAWPLFPRQLSIGMRRRVEFARVLLLRPAMVLADEPFTGVDAITRAVLWRLMREVWAATQATIIVSTHDVAEAIYLAQRILVLSPNDRHEPLFIRDNPLNGDEHAADVSPDTYHALRMELLSRLEGRKNE